LEKKETRKDEIRTWADQYPEVKRWLAKLQEKDQSAQSLRTFCQWTQKSPPELLELKVKDPTANKVEKLLDDYLAAEIPGVTNSIKFHISTAVKSFFKHNYADLARASGVVTLEQVKPYHKLVKEGLRRLWTYAQNQRDRALVTFVNSTAIAKETLSNLKWSHLEETWEKIDLPCINIGSELLKGHGQGKYKGVRQITFLTPEAKRDLLNYKEWIEGKLGRKLTSEDNIWLETYAPYKPLRYQGFGSLMLELSKNAGVPFSWHDGRRWVNTALEGVKINPNWAKKIRGRKVRGEDSPYSQPLIEQLRETFREAVPLLEFTSERPAIPKEVQEKLAQMEEEQKALKRQYGIFRKSRHIKPPEEEPENEASRCEDGKHCQQIVSENDLSEFLCEGWKVVATLPSGKIVIDR
jgi:hypothetical protein